MTGVQGIEANTLYTRQYFQVFAAVMLFMTGVALQFHFGQYVDYLGHGVGTLGRLLAISTIGTLLIRLQLGGWIDRFGCRPTWIVGTLIVAAAVGAVQFVELLWLIAILRTISTMAMAAVMTTVAVFAAQIAPPHRRAESIGTMGLAGFTGMVIGPTLGDWIFSGETASITPYRIFFTASAVCSLLACGVMLLSSLPPSAGPAGLLPRDPSDSADLPTAPLRRKRGSTLRVIFANWPGSILVIGMVFSMVFCLLIAFLERLAEERGFKDIKVFFLTYGPAAIVLRILFRRLPEQLGRTRTLLGGLLLLVTGLLCLVGVSTQVELILPALLMGSGHAFIFPSMVDLSAERLPPHHRGTGTALILGAGDVGMLSGFLFLGELINAVGFDKALIALAMTVLAGATFFAIARRHILLRSRR